MGTSRARYGSGSITARGPGRWQIRLSAGNDPVTGRRRVVTETVVGTKKAASDRLEAIRRHLHHAPTATAATVGDLIDEWLRHLEVRPQTEANYRRSIDRDLRPRLGDRRLDKLSTLDVQRCYSQLRDAGAAAHRIRLAHAVLSKMLTDAGRWGWVSRNVASHATVPALPPRQHRAVDAGDIGKLVTAASQHSPTTALWFHLHVVTGARRSEVLALRWSDVDLVAGRVTFAQVLERRDGKISTRAGTKTGPGRTATIGDVTVQLLTEHLARITTALGEEIPADSFVISHEPDGATPWRPDYASHLFARLADAAGITGVRLHDIRHTAISTVIAATRDLLVASRFAGHSRIGTTTDLYGHELAGQRTPAVSALEQLAGGNQPATRKS